MPFVGVRLGGRLRATRGQLVHRQHDPEDELAVLRARVEELELELKARDAFILAAAHELRNPVSPLVLHLQRLLSAARDAQQRAEGEGTLSAAWLSGQLELLSRRVARFNSALNRILDVSRMQSGGIELVCEDCDLSEVVRDVVAGFERELLAARSELTLECEGSLRGSWDRLRVEQIVSNLVSNAIRYGNSQPIRVSLERASGAAILRVRDHGPGIAAEDQTRIFGRFERGTTQNRSGFGVGLWIVSQLSEAMGGSVHLESRAGEGAVFTVTLPASEHGSGNVR